MERNERHGNPDLGEVEKIVQAVAHGELTRRQFLERGVALGLSLTAIAAVLGACGTDEVTDGATPAAMDTTLPKSITILNWSDYMSPRCLKDFEDQYGVKVKETFHDGNEVVYAKLSAGATGYDAIWLNDMWVTVHRKADLIQPLNMEYIPNFKYVTDAVFQKSAFDNPDEQNGKKYSVPFMFGTTGYAATLAKVPSPMDSWDQLWDEKYKREISMLTAARDVLGVGLIKLGYSPNTTSQEELDAAQASLIEQKPLVLKYDAMNTRRSIVQGLALTHCWDGDVGLALHTIPPEDVRYMLPSQGYIVWVDAICIPKASKNVYATHLFLNHLLDPEQAGENANFTGYHCAVTEGVEYYTSELQRSMRPTEEQMANGKVAEDVGEFQKQYEQAWQNVKAA